MRGIVTPVVPDTIGREIDIDAPPVLLTWHGYERVRYAGENANGWIVELDELRAYAARAPRSRGT